MQCFCRYSEKKSVLLLRHMLIFVILRRIFERAAPRVKSIRLIRFSGMNVL